MSAKPRFSQPDLESLGVRPNYLHFIDSVDVVTDDHTLFIGFDTEYVSGGCDDGLKNHVLSYQAYAVHPPTKSEWFFAADTEDSHRLSLEEVVKFTLIEGKLQNKFHDWPTKIILITHWSVAEMTSVSNFNELKNKFDGVRRTFVSLMEPLKIKFHDHNRNEHFVSITLRDTLLLAPENAKSLEKLGETIGIPKLHVSSEHKSDLRTLKNSEPKEFWAYGMTDAVISALYYIRTLGAAQIMLGDLDVQPLTLGSLAPGLVFKIWEESDICRLKVLGLHAVERKVQTRWGTRTKCEFEDLPKKAQMKKTAAKGYMGGRNEAFWYGMSPEGTWCDLDLCGAYPTAMCSIGLPLWNELRLVSSIEELTPEVMGVAHVRFSFPAHVRFPSIPVTTDTGLIFPRTGSCWATSAEIWLAKQLGADVALSGVEDGVSVFNGFVLPLDHSVRPFEIVAKFIHEKRIQYKSVDKLLADLYKQLGNSVYGKIAQAVKPKKVFDTREAKMKNLPPSKLTNHYIALHITALVRGLVAELLNAIPASYKVISITTDGFITDFPEASAGELCGGHFACKFADARELVAGTRAILEVKHRPERVVCFRTRGQATVGNDGNLQMVDGESFVLGEDEIVLAQGGIKLKSAGKSERNNILVRMFVEREAGQSYEVDQKRGFREIYNKDGAADLNSFPKQIQYTMDFDWKRRASAHGQSEIEGVSHLWFDTVPVESLEEYEDLRSEWKNFRKRGRQLKTEKDLLDFLEDLAVSPGCVRKHKGTANAVQTAKKAFLRACAQGLWGLPRHRQNKELAEALTAHGFTTTVREVENAARKSNKPLENCVEKTEAVGAFLEVVSTIMPGFPVSRICGEGTLPRGRSTSLRR